MEVLKYCCIFLISFIVNHVTIFAFQRVMILRDLNEGHTIVGGTVRLQCQTSFHSKYVSIKWMAGDVSLNADFIEEDTRPSFSHMTVSRLKIPDAQLYHSQIYTCLIVHKEKADFRFSDQLLLSVWDVKNHSIIFGQINAFESTALEISVHIRAHPNISSVTWVHGGNETVIVDPPATNKFPDNQSNYVVRLPFKTLTPEDLGVYSVIAKTDFDKEMTSFSVDLSNKLVVNLSLDKIDNNTVGTFKCETVSFPRKKIFWIFKKMYAKQPLFYSGSYESNGTILQESKVEENGLKVTSYLSVNMSETGFVECHVGEFWTGSHVLNVSNGFEIFAKDLVKYDNGTNVVYSNLVTTTHLACVVSSDSKYVSQLQWYDDQRMVNTSDHQANGHMSYNIIVIAPHYYHSEETNYACTALTRSGEVESKTVKWVLKKIPSTDFQITMEDTKKGHTVEGESLELTCKIVFYTTAEVEWQFLNTTWETLEPEESVAEELDSLDSYKYTITSRYKTRANTSKAGFYRCVAKHGPATKSDDIWVPVYRVNETVVKFDNIASGFDKSKKQIRVFLNAHPKPSIQWFGSNGQLIPNSSISTNYTLKGDENNYVTILSFQKLTPESNGKYTVVAGNKTLSVMVSVTGIPTIRMKAHELNEDTSTAIVKCASVGHPEPEIRWFFVKCVTLEYCLEHGQWNDTNSKEKTELYHARDGLEIVSYVSVNLSEAGILRCLSRNSLGMNYTDSGVLYPKNKFDIFAKGAFLQNSTKIVESVDGEMLTVMCVSSTYHYAETNSVSPDHNQTFTIRKLLFKTLFSFVAIREIFLGKDADEYIVCMSLTLDGELKFKRMRLKRTGSGTLFIKTNMKTKLLEVNFGEKWKFECKAEGNPTPVVKWFKDNHTIEESDKIKFLNGDQELEISDIDLEDAGEYKCQASNRFKTLTEKQILSPISGKNNRWIYATVFVAVVASIVTIATILYIKIRRQKAFLAELKAEGLTYFERGNLENLNPNLGIEEQADLLPYDKKWEIPFQKVKLGKQLGSGAFGVVFEAHIVNHFPDEDTKTVAIKTTSPNSGLESIKNLAKELKIMCYLGKDLNIVNLLGACTEKITKKQLYIVVEYCKFGNLRDYIRRRGPNFVDQKNYHTDKFKWSIGTEDDRRSERIDVDESRITARYSTTTQSICSKDFLIWAFQVCSGMEYLGSRRIVHGDLAARNILLTDDNVVKVSDFGLARRMYRDKDYVKKGDGPLPVKWMAIESIERGIFSIESDVWSFGIVLWELFSLAGTPYPGLRFDEHFLKKLKDGYRMGCPRAATTSIYGIMLRCWESDPLRRPSFASLIEKFGFMLDDTIKNYYLDMRSGYILMNSLTDQEDYLTMVNPPTFENIAGCSLSNLGHNYVNATFISDDAQTIR